MSMVNHNEDLAATKYCDLDNPDIQQTAQRLAAGTASPDEAAVKIFRWVRDQIPFGLDLIKVKALLYKRDMLGIVLIFIVNPSQKKQHNR